MADERPPTLDPAAAARWLRVAPPASPWLHEEVGRRMAERLQWIKREPAAWADWDPVRGGLEAHRLVAARYPKSERFVPAGRAEAAQAAIKSIAPGLWSRLTGPGLQVGPLPAGRAQMLWANMALHTAADPQALLAAWRESLEVDGFVMFSCLGPDTLRELRGLYASLGWPPPAHEFTDMHDWGDMLVHGGFAEPVMDMERLTLTWETPARLLAELRGLGINLHRGRFPALRGRRWRARLAEAIEQGLRGPDGRLALTFEIIYGHALKPLPRPRLSEATGVGLDDMRAMLKGGQRPAR